MEFLKRLFKSDSKPEEKNEAKMPHQNSIATTGKVSIWVGNFGSEDELDAYIFERFSKDFGFILNERNLPEISVEEEKKSIEELLTGFSWYKDFIEEAISLSKSKGIREASAAAVFHAVDYSKISGDSLPSEPFQFLGVCNFGGR